MGVLEEETRLRITKLLKRHPKGLMISDLASRLKINRNVMAKYLEMLLIAGEVEMDFRGNAKIFTLSQRIPVFTLLENSSDFVIMLDAAARILRVNAPVLALTGIPGSDILGKRCRDVDHPFFKAIPCSENPETSGQVRDISCTIDGKGLHFRIKQNPVVLEDGSRGSVLICEDITGEIQNREQLALSEARFRAIIEDQTEFIIRFLPDGKLTFLNGSGARFLGKDPDVLLGTIATSLISSEDLPYIKESIRSLDRENPVQTLEFRVRDENGNIHWQQWTFRALFNDGGTVSEYQGVGRDITGRFEADALVTRHAADLEFLSEKARDFIQTPAGLALYRKILKDVSEMVPDALLALSTFDPANNISTVLAADGEELEKTFRHFFGTELVGMTFHITDPTALKILNSGALHKIYGGLYTGFFCQVPFDACVKMEEALNMGEIYAFGFIMQDRLLGNIAIVIRKGEQFPRPGLLDVYLRQASIAMAWHTAEETCSRENTIQRDEHK
jgi:PAS domain S-box-containing protein